MRFYKNFSISYLFQTALMMRSTLPSDQEIINNLNQNSITRRKAEEQLFNQYSYFIREGKIKYSISEDDSFNAYADAVLSAIQAIRNLSFEGRSSLKTYIYQIFHNKCVDVLRKMSSNKDKVHQTVSITDKLSELSDEAKSVIEQMTERSDWDLLKQKLSQLRDSCRQLLSLSADGFTDKEISLTLAYKTADVVKTSRLRCLEKLRQMYKVR